jgi:hypothetical protein
MAKCFETWTVLPHGPIEKLSENLWRVEGTMNDGKIKRVMTIARMKDGRLVVHNAIALEPELQAEIEAFGTPAAIVVPNGFHRQARGPSRGTSTRGPSPTSSGSSCLTVRW